jgi:methyl-accepting chemotaxis protein
MNSEFSDLQTAQDLKKLCDVVNQAIHKAEVTLEKANKIDEMQSLIAEGKSVRSTIEETKKYLELKKEEIQKLDNSTTQNLLDSQELHEQLEKLKKLPKQLAELGLDQQLLSNIQNHLSQLQNIDANIITHKNEIQELITFSQSQSDDIRTTLEKIKTGKQIAEDLEQQARTLQLATVSLLQEINFLGGSDKLVENFEQLQEISKCLENLESQIQSSINAFLDNYLPKFEAGKSQIEQWRNDVFLKTEQTLNQINQVSKSINESSKKLNQDYYYAKTNLKKLEEKELELREIARSITELTQSLGGDKLFVNVIKKITELDDFIASEKNSFNLLGRKLEQALRDEFQDLLNQEIKKLEVTYLQEINRLDKENKHLKKSFGLTSIGLFGR